MFIGIKNFEPVGSDDFLIDVKNRSITSYGRKIASPHLSDFNLPVGFNPQQISNQVVKQLPDDALIALTSDDHALDDIQVDGELVVIDGGDETNPSLTIKSPSKIYKRSLSADLQKML